MRYKLFCILFVLFAVSLGKAASIPHFSNCCLWVYADSSKVGDKQRVELLTDFSNYKNNAIQTDSANQPLLVAPNALLNNHSVIRLNGSSDYLSFPSLDSVQSVFVLFKHKTGNQNYATIFGNADPNLQNWHGNSGTGLIYPYPLTQNVLQGQGFVNGIPTPVGLMVKPKSYAIYSFITAGPTSIATLGESLNLYYWNGDIAEVILYNRQLDSNERVGVEAYLRNKYAPPVSLGPDTILNNFCAFQLVAGKNYVSYRWSTGDTAAAISVKSTGRYSVKVTDVFGFVSQDSILVTYPEVKPPVSTTVCNGSSTVWNTGLSHQAYKFHWQDNSTDSLLVLNTPGRYSLTVTDTKGCSAVAAEQIGADSFPQSLKISSSDTVQFCHGGKLTPLSSFSGKVRYQWSNGDTSLSCYPSNAATYSLLATDQNGCQAKDSVFVRLSAGSVPHIAVQVYAGAICLGSTDSLFDKSYTTDGSQIKSRRWSLGDGSQADLPFVVHAYVSASDTGWLNVRLSDTTSYGCFTDTLFHLHVGSIPQSKFAYSSPVVNKAVAFSVPGNPSTGLTYNWSFGDSTQPLLDTSSAASPTHLFTNAVSYQVHLQVTSSWGCTSASTQAVSIGYDPSSIAGLGLWLRSDSGYTLGANNAVTILKDYSGHNNTALQPNALQAPVWVDSISLLNNKPIMRFNGTSSNLSYNEISNTRDCFVVLKYPVGQQGYAPLLCDANYADFQTSSGSNLFGYYTSDSITSGKVLINGNSIAPSDAQKPQQYAILSIYPIGNLRTSDIGSDREGRYYFQGDAAEVILYTRTLDSLQRNSVISYLRQKYAPPVQLVGNLHPSGFCPVALSAGNRFVHYKWSTGDTTSSISVKQSGRYKVTTQDVFGYYSSDSVEVTFPIPNHLQDTLLCLGSSTVWNTGLSHQAYKFHWQDNSTDSMLLVSKQEWAKLVVTDNNGCTFNDSAYIAIDSFKLKAILRANDSLICLGNRLELPNSGELRLKWINWSDGSNQFYCIPKSSGWYRMYAVDSTGCSSTDSLRVRIKGIAPKVDFSFAGKVCPSDTIQLQDNSHTLDGSFIQQGRWIIQYTDTLPIFSNQVVLPKSFSSNNFAISRTVETSTGCSNDTTIQLALFPKPFIGFNLAGHCSGSELLFTIQDTLKGNVVSNYIWNFADGSDSIATTNSYQWHKFVAAGQYTVQLKVHTEQGCFYESSQHITVQQSPKAGLIIGPACVNQQISFSDQSLFANSFKINFGDGSPTQAGATTLHTYIDTGNYQLFYITTSNNACSDTLRKSVHIGSNPVAKFSIGGPVCQNATLHLMDSSYSNASTIIHSWLWVIGGAAYSGQNPVVSLLNVGNTEVQLVVVDSNGCKSTGYSQEIQVSAAPNPNFNILTGNGFMAPPFSVQLQPIDTIEPTYRWSWGTMQNVLDTVTGSNPTALVASSGDYLFKLKIISPKGCQDSAVQNLTITNPIFDLKLIAIYPQIDSAGYLGLSIYFQNNSNRILSQFQISVNVDGQVGEAENWSGKLLPGEISTYHLKSSLQIQSVSNAKAVCVSLALPDGFQDSNAADNEQCEPLTGYGFQVVSPFPNPATDRLQIPVIVPSADVMSVYICNSNSIIVMQNNNWQVTKGVNTIVLATSTLAKGMYYYQVVYRGESKSGKFIKD